MRFAGMLLLLAGWFVVLSALVLLASPGLRGVFVSSGAALEIVGFILAFRKETS